MFQIAARRSTSSQAIELVDQAISWAIAAGASDVHFNPVGGDAVGQTWQIRFRVDGVLGAGRVARCDDQTDPVTRLLSLAGLPTYRAAAPAEGRLLWNGPDKDSAMGEELRLSVFPTITGPRAVLRRGGAGPPRTLDDLGLDQRVARELKSACDRPAGLVLVAGPAGAGKTTTLHACLQHIADDSSGDDDRPRRSVVTVEDPVEATLPGIVQSQVTADWPLAEAFRAAMRQDADVLMASEIRDAATATAVVDAAMTGHLVLASVHAASVGGAVTRLIRGGVDAAAVADALIAVCQIRLLRVRCRVETADQNASRYRGRRPIATVFLADRDAGPSLVEAIGGGASAMQIDALLNAAGAESLWTASQTAVAAGWTDEAEVRRVLGPSPSQPS